MLSIDWTLTIRLASVAQYLFFDVPPAHVVRGTRAVGVDAGNLTEPSSYFPASYAGRGGMIQRTVAGTASQGRAISRYTYNVYYVKSTTGALYYEPRSSGIEKEALELLRLIEVRLGRWLAYVDSCLSAEGELARCQGFWKLVGGTFIGICFIVVAAVAAKTMLDRRRGRPISDDSKYRRPE